MWINDERLHSVTKLAEHLRTFQFHIREQRVGRALGNNTQDTCCDEDFSPVYSYRIYVLHFSWHIFELYTETVK